MFIPGDLYKKILLAMPIVCVDLLVLDQAERVLLVKRKNEPAKGQWWVPGGRVHMGETRLAAAVRKLREECGLTADEQSLAEIATEDLILPDGQGGISHAVATVYRVEVGKNPKVVLDGQSDGYEWRTPGAWLAEDIHPYVRGIIGQRI
jgi:ADP-ribose pyrophosphatase YjhB (NUDIX family)